MTIVGPFGHLFHATVDANRLHEIRANLIIHWGRLEAAKNATVLLRIMATFLSGFAIDSFERLVRTSDS